MKKYLFILVLITSTVIQACTDATADQESIASFDAFEKKFIASIKQAESPLGEVPAFRTIETTSVQRYLCGLAEANLLGGSCLSFRELGEILRLPPEDIYEFVQNGLYKGAICRNLQWYYRNIFIEKKNVPLSQFKRVIKWDESEGGLSVQEMEEVLKNRSVKLCLLRPKKVSSPNNLIPYLQALVDASNAETVTGVLFNYRSTETVRNALRKDEKACYSIYLACCRYYERLNPPSLLVAVQQNRVEPKEPSLPSLLWDKLTGCFSNSSAAADRSTSYRAADETEAAPLIDKKRY